MIISDDEKRIYLSLANQAIVSHLNNHELPKEIITQAQSCTTATYKLGVFITLRKNHNLRGCIGCITASTPLITTIPNYAIQAAINDTRFSPVTITEFPDISLSLSILTPPSPAENYTQIVIGRHGVIFNYNHHRSVFLPEVATEQNWNLEMLLLQLEYKAGAPSGSWKKATYEIFESIKF